MLLVAILFVLPAFGQSELEFGADFNVGGAKVVAFGHAVPPTDGIPNYDLLWSKSKPLVLPAKGGGWNIRFDVGGE